MFVLLLRVAALMTLLPVILADSSCPNLNPSASASIPNLPPPSPPSLLSEKLVLAYNHFTDPNLHPTSISKYNYLQQLQNADTAMYYGLLATHLKEIMPIVYTPTVGEGCTRWSHTWAATSGASAGRGLYIPITDSSPEQISSLLSSTTKSRIDAIVMTDGERILGLGDLGVNGMGIPVGKLALYSGLGGVNPEHCLPITLDVGTNTQLYLDPNSTYIGLKQTRVRGDEYDQFVDNVITEIKKKWGKNTLIQHEDFGNANAFRLLDRYRSAGNVNLFNDDIEGTASVVLAGVISSMKLIARLDPTAPPPLLSEQTFLFLGAGEAGVGIADLISRYIVENSNPKVSIEQARKNIWLVDSKGLIVSTRTNLVEHKQRYAHTYTHSNSPPTNLLDAVNSLNPSVLIGVAAQPNTFTKQIITKMAANNKHPTIFALSNPTSKCECTAKQAYEWSNGAAIFATGSPFDDVDFEGTIKSTGQGNNAYIFPGVGLASIVAKANKISETDFLIAAETVSDMVDYNIAMKNGNVYPELERVREVSKLIGIKVAKNIIREGRSDSKLSLGEVEEAVENYMWSYDE